MKPTRLFLVCLAVTLWPTLASAAGAAREPLDYGIFRNDEEIGASQVTFQQDGDRLIVETTVKIVVKVALIPVYRLNERKREVWRNGVMVEYMAELEENGQKATVQARAKNGTLIAEGPAGRTEAPVGLLPSTYWNDKTVGQTRLLDSTTGAVVKVAVSSGGMSPAATVSGPVQARHYRMTGDLVRDLWYDENGALVTLRFKESTGSTIEYRRK